MSDERDELFALFADLVVQLLQAPLTVAQFSLLLRTLLTWAEQALAGPHGDAYDEPPARHRRGAASSCCAATPPPSWNGTRCCGRWCSAP